MKRVDDFGLKTSKNAMPDRMAQDSESVARDLSTTGVDVTADQMCLNRSIWRRFARQIEHGF